MKFIAYYPIIHLALLNYIHKQERNLHKLEENTCLTYAFAIFHVNNFLLSAKIGNS